MVDNLFQRPVFTVVLLLGSGLAAILIGRNFLVSENPAAARAMENLRPNVNHSVSDAAVEVSSGKSSVVRSFDPSVLRSIDTRVNNLVQPRKLHAPNRSTSQSIDHKASARTTDIHHDAGRQDAAPSRSHQSAGIPFSFSIPDDRLVSGSPEDEALYQAQVRFKEELNSLTEADSASPEYAAQWNRSAASHDDYLRLHLGGPAYVQLTAVAMQAEEAAHERGKDSSSTHEPNQLAR